MTLRLPFTILACLYFYHLPVLGKNQNISTTISKNAPIIWHLWKQNKNVSIFYQDDKKEVLIPVKTIINVDSTLSGFLLFVQDTSNMSNWLAQTKYSKVIKKYSYNDIIFKNTFLTFWPVKEREIIIRSIYKQNPDLTLDISLYDMSHYEPYDENTMRMALINGHWHITPTLKQSIKIAEPPTKHANIEQINTSLDIKYQFTVDGKGDIPFWLYKRLSLNGIWQSMNNLVEQLPRSVWQQQKIPSIKEISSSVSHNKIQ